MTPVEDAVLEDISCLLYAVARILREDSCDNEHSNEYRLARLVQHAQYQVDKLIDRDSLGWDWGAQVKTSVGEDKK